MKRTLVALAFLSSTTLFATNGGLMTGVTPQSNALGGAAASMWISGGDALRRNPALLSQIPGENGNVHLDASVNLFKQNGKANIGAGEESTADGISPVPTLAVTYKVDDKLGFGLLAAVTGGASADYSTKATVSNILADAMYSRVGLGAAYAVTPELSIGVSPFLSYSTLKLHLNGGPDASGAAGFGAVFGAGFQAAEGLRFGTSYTLKTNYTYKSVIDLGTLGPAQTPSGNLSDIDSGDPAEFTIGASYAVSNWKFALDYLLIFWSTSGGQADLGWKNQNVIAFGTEYAVNSDWALRLGFNWATTPIESASAEVGHNTVDINGSAVFQQSISLMNIAAFPGFTRTHISAGAGYQVSKSLHADIAVMYAPESTASRAGTTVATPYSFTGKVSQWAVGLGAGYTF